VAKVVISLLKDKPEFHFLNSNRWYASHIVMVMLDLTHERLLVLEGGFMLTTSRAFWLTP